MAIAVPSSVLDLLEAARRVLLIGHVGPDGDCVGATLSLARGLEALGKHVDVCVDDILSGFLRRIDTSDRIRRAADLVGGGWDAAALVDVAEGSRIGQVNERLLPGVNALAIVDHHHVTVERAGFPLAPEALLATWIDSAFPAASLMVEAILARWRARTRSVPAAELHAPALAGFATDTGFGRFDNADAEHLGYFKHMLEEAGVSVEALLERLRFRVPQPVWDIAVNGLLPSSSELDGPEIEALRQLEARGVLVEEQIRDGLALVLVPRALLDALVALGRIQEPELVDRDVLYALKKERMSRLREAGATMTVLLAESADQRVWVSIRAPDSAARELAEFLGGGGHDRAAGATLGGCTVDAARDRVLGWVASRRSG